MYDIIVIGGGIAGGSYAILEAKKGLKVAVLEYATYPLHKVCGEYISNESIDFLTTLGVAFPLKKLPKINTFILTSPSGKVYKQKLQQGGFGWSRYEMDNAIKQTAIANGVHWIKDKVISYTKNKTYTVIGKQSEYTSKAVIGAWGKRSNLDVDLKRKFYFSKQSRLTNWVGIKYHIKIPFPSDTIALHSFKNGYCGISKIENDTVCVCYLMRAINLKNYSIKEAEEKFLYKNPFLKEIFTKAEFVFANPIAISQVNFKSKEKNIQNVLMLGDSAGLIAPLCGNGMSMALHSAKLASENPNTYNKAWQTNFGVRIRFGKTVQFLFGNRILMEMLIFILRVFPFLGRFLTKLSHGKPF